jgi:hypothetical protein
MSSNEDQDCEPYPFIASFFSDLASANLHWPALGDIVRKFENQDLFSIEEVAQLMEGSLRDDFGLSLGNARFVLDKVRMEMQRVDHINKRRKHRHN